MNRKLFRFLPVCHSALRLQYKCTFRVQNLSFCSLPKHTLNATNPVNNIQEQSSSSSVQPSEEETKELEERVKFKFITHKGKDIEVEAECGRSVMAMGVLSEVFSEATCGGVLECTICHVYVDDEIANIFKKVSKREEDKLDATKYLKPNSRLSCQLFVTKKMEGARFQLPVPTNSLMQDEYPS